MRPIFAPTYKQKKQVEKYIRALYHELVLFLQSRNFFAMYQIMRSKGESWAGPCRKLSMIGMFFIVFASVGTAEVLEKLQV